MARVTLTYNVQVVASVDLDTNDTSFKIDLSHIDYEGPTHFIVEPWHGTMRNNELANNAIVVLREKMRDKRQVASVQQEN